MTEIRKVSDYNDAISKVKNAQARASSLAQSISFDQLFDSALENQTLKGMTEGVVPNVNYKVPFDAATIAQVLTDDELERIEQQRRRDQDAEAPDVLTSQNINEVAQASSRLDITPFQMFMEKSIQVLENVSQMEYRVNDLTEQYIQGKASIDEVSIETAKLNLAVTFVTTVVTTASQTFKELTQMQI